MSLNGNRFNRHPKTTIAVVLLMIFLLLDLCLGFFFCPRIIGTPDAYYHHDLPRKVSGTKLWGGHEYRVFTNSLGFVDGSPREVPLVSKNHRILLMGDSFVEGLGLEYDKTFAGRLASDLASYGVEVLNAGVTSYSPKLYYLKTKYLMEYTGLRFDEIFVFIDISDIQDEILYGDFQPKAEIFLSEYFLFNKIDSFLRGRSFSYYSVRRLFDKFLSKKPKKFEISEKLIDEVYAGEWEIERPLWTVDDDIFSRWGKTGLDSAGFYITKLKELCDMHNIKMHVAVYPWPVQIRYGDLDSIQVRYWRALSEREGIDFINFFPLFIGTAGRSPEDIYSEFFIAGDDHWNENGHRLVADVLEKKWLDEHGGRFVGPGKN